MGKIKHITPILITLCVVFLFYVKRFVFLKFYPPVCNCFLFLVFFVSLFTKETVIQKFARMCGDKLEKQAWDYTRKVTYVWSVFTFINLIISIWTIFLPDKSSPFGIATSSLTFSIILFVFVSPWLCLAKMERKKISRCPKRNGFCVCGF